MLLETVADHEFAEAVKTLAFETKRQFVRRIPITGSRDLTHSLSCMIKDDCHIDQVIIITEERSAVIVYTADHEYDKI